ncbi:MAG: hypothetical protein APF81_19180 [Desulfosporosinus sp. BRH_c37]|nr:MAG: hypothetical protein APF81_19180 [Desulfosporosinus sp. BRH_c37]
MFNMKQVTQLLKEEKETLLKEYDLRVKEKLNMAQKTGRPVWSEPRKKGFESLINDLIAVLAVDKHLPTSLDIYRKMRVQYQEQFNANILSINPPKLEEMQFWMEIIITCLLRRLEKDGNDANLIQEIHSKVIMGINIIIWHYREDQLLKDFHNQEQKLMAGIVAAQENERKRLAWDLHDGVIQSLASILLRLQIVEHSTNNDSELNFELKEIEQLVRETVQACRLVSVDMDSFWLTKAGYFPTLRAYLRTYENKTALKVNLEVYGEGGPIDKSVEIAIFRVLQEALQNIRKHAEAKSVDIHIEIDQQNVTFNIKDDGKGFDFATVKGEDYRNISNAANFGLFSIEQRVKLLGGTFNIKTAPNEGTLITVCVPCCGHEKSGMSSQKRGSPWIRSRS